MWLRYCDVMAGASWCAAAITAIAAAAPAVVAELITQGAAWALSKL